MNLLYLVLGTIVALIAISFFFDFNIGPLAVLSALLIGKICLGLSSSKVVAMAPAGTILTMVVLSAFYGFAMENGTAEALIAHLLERFGRRLSLLPVVVFFLTALLSGVGLGSGNATMIMAPIALTIAAEAAFDPLSMAAAVGCGAAVGSNLPFSFGGLIAVTLIEESGAMADATPAIMQAAIRNAAIQFICFFAVFLLKHGYKNRGISLQRAPELNPMQKKTAWLILAVVLLSIVPPILDMVIHTPWSSTLSGICDINTVMLLGIIAAMLMKLADVRQIAKKQVPWLLIVVISGMSMLIGIAREGGIVDWLGQVLSKNLPTGLIPCIMLLIGMLMSLFGGAISVVVPTLFPMVPGVAAATGLNMGSLFGCVLVGATCGGLCPYSTGGMIMMSAYPKVQNRQRFMLGLLCMPFFQTLVSILVYMI